MNWVFKNNIEKRMLLLIWGDLLVCVIAFFLSLNRILDINMLDIPHYKLIELKIGFFTALVVFSSFLLELYGSKRVFDRKLLLFKSGFAALLSFLTLNAVYFAIPDLAIDWKTLAFALFIFFILQCLWRFLYYFLMKLPIFTRKVLILGTGTKAKKAGSLLNTTSNNFQFKGYISTSNDPVVVPESKIIADAGNVIEKVREEKIKTIVVALTEHRGNQVIDKLLTCKLMGVDIMDLPTFYQLLTGKLPVEDIDPSWIVHNRGFTITIIGKLLKRVLDLILSILGILVVTPFFPLIAVLIKLDSSGPIFYKQLRVGEMEKEFFVYKFRTMKKDAEAKTGVTWAQENDPRITKIGGFLRKTRLDELPQLVNVLKGEMSLIGPRPERPELVEKIKKVTSFYKERHYIKPGITGWAQIKYSYGASFGDSIEKLRYDLYYVQNMSFFLDILILFETIKVVLFRRGGR